jgi:hypothetical protein
LASIIRSSDWSVAPACLPRVTRKASCPTGCSERPESDQHQRDADDRHHDQPAGKQGDETQEEHQENEIDREHDRGRGEEVAHGLIFGDSARHRAGAALALGHRQVHHLLEQLLRQLRVELAPDFVDEARASDPQHEVEQQRNHHAGREHPQGRHRLVRDHAVVDVHREQRHREREQVDDQGREDDRPELPAHLPHLGPEPMLALGFVPRPLILALAGGVDFDGDGAPGVGGLELGKLDPHRLGEARCVDQALTAARFQKDCGTVVAEL